MKIQRPSNEGRSSTDLAMNWENWGVQYTYSEWMNNRWDQAKCQPVVVAGGENAHGRVYRLMIPPEDWGTLLNK